MARIVSSLLCTAHLLALSISTYCAAIEIETILFTGWLCSATGIAAGAASLWCSRPVLAGACFFTFGLAVTLLILEAVFLQLGPVRAALPFCVVFVINQFVCTLVILVEMNLMMAPPGRPASQITLRTLLAAMVGSSVFLAVAKLLLQREHSIMMLIALGLIGLTIVGLCATFFSVIEKLRQVRTAGPTASQDELERSQAPVEH